MSMVERLAAEQAAKNAEASRRLNMNADAPGLAATAYSEPYARGISVEDEYKLALAKKAREENEYRRAQEMIDRNRDYNATRKALDSREEDVMSYNGPGEGHSIPDHFIFNPIDKRTIKEYKSTIDPGLADQWMNYKRMR